MSTALSVPRMTRDQFFDWAEAQDGRYEFDGFGPVAMTGGTANHNQIALNIHMALRLRLRGSGCRPLGPDVGVATIGDTVRYPDGLVTCSPFQGTDRLIPGVVIVFEVISPSSGRVDRIVKVREYAAVPSIRRYIIVESAGAGLTVLTRAEAGQDWTLTTLTQEEILPLPEIGVEVPVAEIYEDVDTAAAGAF